MANATRREPISGARLLSLAVGASGFAAALIGASMRFVTIGRSLGGFGANISFSLENIDADTKKTVVIVSVLGIAALVVAQVPYLRWMATVSLLGAVGLLWASLYALDRANERGVSIRGIAKALANPRPAGGFYVLVVGAVAAAVGSLVTLIARRTSIPFAPVTIVHSVHSGLPGLQVAPTPARPGDRVPLPDRRPGWHSDPAGSGRLRWWDGCYWAPEPMTSLQLPRPGDGSPAQ